MYELKIGENHPATHAAAEWLRAQSPVDLAMWQEAFASNAIEGNRLAELCGETLRLFLAGQPIGERYLLALAWTMRGDSDGVVSIPTGKLRPHGA